jgi:hypothetical protein
MRTGKFTLFLCFSAGKNSKAYGEVHVALAPVQTVSVQGSSHPHFLNPLYGEVHLDF